MADVDPKPLNNRKGPALGGGGGCCCCLLVWDFLQPSPLAGARQPALSRAQQPPSSEEREDAPWRWDWSSGVGFDFVFSVICLIDGDHKDVVNINLPVSAILQ